jgi:hypothetical protein
MSPSSNHQPSLQSSDNQTEASQDESSKSHGILNAMSKLPVKHAFQYTRKDKQETKTSQDFVPTPSLLKV